MLTKEILDSHPLKVLKKEIAKQNIKGYSNMKRSELTDLMLKHKEKFGHIKAAEKKAPKAKAPKEKKPKGKGVNEKKILKELINLDKEGNLQLTEKQLLKLTESAKSKPIKEKKAKGPKKPRSEKQLANDKKLGKDAKAKAAAKKAKK
jgi:hypothetical protein